MDTGLDNQNYLGKEASELADVVFLVECDGSKDQYNLWCEYSVKSRSNIAPLAEDDIKQLKAELTGNYDKLLSRILTVNDRVKDNYHTRYDWKDISSGIMLTIGHVGEGKNKLPVCVSFNFAEINGHKICFYYTCSRANESEMVRKWLIERFQLTHDNYTRWNHVDSNNFHNCLNSLDSLDKEPRNVKTIDLMTPRAIRTNWYPGCKFKENEILLKILGDAPLNWNMTKEWRYWNANFDEWIWAETLEDAKANFRSLEWWEHRDETEMPAYVKDKFNPISIPPIINTTYGKIFKVVMHNIEDSGDKGCYVAFTDWIATFKTKQK